MLKSQLKSFKGKIDYREYGGAPLLGLKKPVLKPMEVQMLLL